MVAIIRRYIFCNFGLNNVFTSIKFCDLNAEMVQGRQILMFNTIIVLVGSYKILRF